MKCCLNSRLPMQIMPKADQIKFAERDINSIPDYIEFNKTIILECWTNDVDWNKISNFNKLCKEDFMLCVSSVQAAKTANELNIKWYWGFPVSSLYEAKALARLGSIYLKLDAPLFFQWDLVKKVLPDMKFRHTPNVAYNDGLPRENGVSGTWIRPEDLVLYENYIDVIEFEKCDREQEQTLFRIYMEDKKWDVIIKLLIANLDYEGTGRMIPKEFGEKRLNCRQACEQGGACTICWRTLKLADPDRVEAYLQPHTIIKHS